MAVHYAACWQIITTYSTGSVFHLADCSECANSNQRVKLQQKRPHYKASSSDSGRNYMLNIAINHA